MTRIAFLIFCLSLNACSVSKHHSDSAFNGLSVKKAQKIQKENYKNYTNSYNYKMHQEVEKRQKGGLHPSKYKRKSKAK
jgi:hypothetical protein